MSSTTTNIGLTKPAMTDTWGNIIPGIASSMDTIDNRLGILSKKFYVDVKNPPAPLSGAIGDGVTDDTAAIQAIVSAYPYVYFPDGTYLIKDTTTNKGILPISNSHLLGSGNAVLKLGASSCNIISNYVRDFGVSGYGALNNVTIENLEFNCNSGSLADPASASAPNGDNYSYGIYIVRAKNIKIRNCYFHDSWYGGYNLFGVDGQTVEKCKFYNCGLATAYYPNYAAMGGDSPVDAQSQNVLIRDNKVDTCGGCYRANGGVNNGNVSDQVNWVFENNAFSNCQTGIFLYNGNFKKVTVDDNKFVNVLSRVVSVNGGGNTYNRVTHCDYIKIVNNYIDVENSTAGITSSSLFYIEAETDSLFQGNTVVMPNDYGSTNNIITYLNTVYGGLDFVEHRILGNYFTIAKASYLIYNGTDADLIFNNNSVKMPSVYNSYFYDAINTTTNNKLLAVGNSFRIDVTLFSSGYFSVKKVRENEGYITKSFQSLAFNDGGTVSTGLNCQNNQPPACFVQAIGTAVEVFISYTQASGNITLSIKDKSGNPMNGVNVAIMCIAWDYMYN